MSRKWLALFLVLILMVSVFAGCAKTEAPEEVAEEPGEVTEEPMEEAIRVTMITDTGGLGDESFNDSAYAGLVKAEEDFGVEVSVLESQTPDDYGPNLSAAAEDGADLIVSVGFLMQSATAEAAAQFPEQKFAIIDETVDAANAAGLTFKEHEGSFLTGVIAGLMTETNKVGFVGGMQYALIEKFQYGFEAGVKAVNPDAEIIVNYTGAFDNPQLGKENALAQNQAGADVIYHASGACGIGVIEAAGEQGFWAIGVDQDQSALDPEHVLCSMIKRVDNATYLATKAVVEGTFDGTNLEFGLAEEGVGYSDNAGNVPADIAEQAEAYRMSIMNGEFEVPYDEATFNAFEMPAM
ncbi:MAG: BMP family ABC transporter substrate-binding protein [Peptostreptococcaceae bacterium]|nr:BMP family ABC transporter substrate-binding protein [Peptostreptococcaceae bacterium]